MQRRTFLAMPGAAAAQSTSPGETLYNGIRLPEVWPPRTGDPRSLEPMPVPWLQNPPEPIPIDVGRQLFVDDFLIARTDLVRTFHQAQKHPASPVLTPAASDGSGRLQQCRLGTGGLFHDPAEGVFKLFYQAGWEGGLALAVSRDLLHWTRPDLGAAGGNLLLAKGHNQEGAGRENCIWLDLDARNPGERIKYMASRFNPAPGEPFSLNNMSHTLHASADGRVWSGPVKVVPAPPRPLPDGRVSDYGSFFFNPFRNVWVFSVKQDTARGRSRHYVESADFFQGADWRRSVYWTAADRLDQPDPSVGDAPQLYCLNAVAYESILLGQFNIHLGPSNEICAKGRFPKLTELKLGFSRDGFHWHRPDRRPFIAATRMEGSWDRAYLHGAAGVCATLDDKLWFPYCGASGMAPDGARGMYFGISVGMATLRRDGFASMDAGPGGGALTTRALTFRGKNLFVNVDCPRGELRAEVLDLNDRVIAPFSMSACAPIAADKALQAVRWKRGSLASLAGRPVKFRFSLRSGRLFAFWVSAQESGAPQKSSRSAI